MHLKLYFLTQMWWADLGWRPGLQATLSLPSSAGLGVRGEQDEINLMAQGKSSLIKQKQRLCTEAKENTRFALYVP